MNIEHAPRTALTHGSAIVCGFILAIWCNQPRRPTANNGALNPGFRIVLPAGKDFRTSQRQDLARVPLRVFRRDDTDPFKACILGDESLSAEWTGQLIAISGTLQNLSKIAPFLLSGRLNGLEFKPLNESRALKYCGSAPAVIYGNK